MSAILLKCLIDLAGVACLEIVGNSLTCSRFVVRHFQRQDANFAIGWCCGIEFCSQSDHRRFGFFCITTNQSGANNFGHCRGPQEFIPAFGTVVVSNLLCCRHLHGRRCRKFGHRGNRGIQLHRVFCCRCQGCVNLHSDNRIGRRDRLRYLFEDCRGSLNGTGNGGYFGERFRNNAGVFAGDAPGDRFRPTMMQGQVVRDSCL